MRHPLAEHETATPPGAVTLGTETYAVAPDGTIDCPADVVDDLRAHYADRYDWYDAVATCDAIKSDGEVCGRELPCPYHSDDSDRED